MSYQLAIIDFVSDEIRLALIKEQFSCRRVVCQGAVVKRDLRARGARQNGPHLAPNRYPVECRRLVLSVLANRAFLPSSDYRRGSKAERDLAMPFVLYRALTNRSLAIYPFRRKTGAPCAFPAAVCRHPAYTSRYILGKDQIPSTVYLLLFFDR